MSESSRAGQARFSSTVPDVLRSPRPTVLPLQKLAQRERSNAEPRGSLLYGESGRTPHPSRIALGPARSDSNAFRRSRYLGLFGRGAGSRRLSYGGGGRRRDRRPPPPRFFAPLSPSFWSFRALCLVFSSSGYCLRPSGFRIVVVGLATAGPADDAGCPRPTPPPLPSCSLCRLRLGRPARASPPLSPPLLAPLCASWPRSRLSSGCTWAICLLKMGPAGRRSRGGASAVAPTAAAPGARSLGLAPASGLDSRAGRCPSTAACPS